MYGLIGNPLGHSFSADFFNRKFKSENISEIYNLFPLPEISSVRNLILSHDDLKGFNVTIPYKEQIIPFLSEMSEEAKAIGAVNVVKVVRANGDVSLKGYNSDAIGFKKSLVPFLKSYMKNALVLGTGGASKAVAYVLRTLGLEVTMVSRHRNNGVISYDDISKEIIDSHHVIVNTTPLGMWPNIDNAPAIPYEFLSDKHLCYDVVYNPEVTLFMKKSAAFGATVKNGLEMLHMQALAAWDIWQQ